MVAEKLSGMTGRQKVTAAVFVVVVIIIIWQIKGLFSGGGTSATIPPAPQGPTTAMAPKPPGTAGVPQPAAMPPAAPASKPEAAAMSAREAELMKMQQETEAKYLAALNELQMLKVSKEIAETNQAIMKAKLDTVASEKSIMQLLAPSTPQTPPQAYAQGLANGAPAAPPSTATTVTSAEPSYTVISVTQLQYKWSAVLGYQGNLYSVSVGDVLPSDGSKVVSIDKSGVMLEKNGEKKKISLVPII